MRQYRVSLAFTTYCDYDVEAEDEQAALDIAKGKYSSGEEGQWTYDYMPNDEADMVEEV